jgi:ribosomal-protein-serine acetyltransferase
MGSFPVSISTPRLLLRGLGPTDAPALARAFAESETHLRPFIGLPETLMPLDALVRRLARFQRWFLDDERYHLGVISRASRDLVGSVILYPKGTEVDVAFWLRHDQVGHGFATEAVRAAGNAAFANPTVRRLNIFCRKKNFRSAALAARLGYVRAGERDDVVRWELARS